MSESRVTWNTAKATLLWLDGKAASEIAAIVGAPSRSAILGFMHRTGVARDEQPGRQSGLRTARSATFWTPERCKIAQTMWLAGETATAIAAEFEYAVTQSSIVGRMHRLGLKKPPVVRAPKAMAAKASKPVESEAKTVAIPGDTRLVARFEAEVPTHGKTLAERGDRECCWPIGRADPLRGQLFCAAPTAFRKSYCANHSPNQVAELRTMRLKDETVRRARPEREPSEADLTELLA